MAPLARAACSHRPLSPPSARAFAWLAMALLLLLGALPTALAAPSLEAATTTIDFGRVIQGQQAVQTLTLKNSGDAALVLGKIQSSCGCTAATLEATTVPPGGTTQLTITLTTTGRQGEQHKSLLLTSNDPARPQLALTVKAVIQVEFAVVPAPPDFGTVEQGQSISLHVAIVRTTGPLPAVAAIKAAVFDPLQVVRHLPIRPDLPGLAGTADQPAAEATAQPAANAVAATGTALPPARPLHPTTTPTWLTAKVVTPPAAATATTAPGAGTAALPLLVTLGADAPLGRFEGTLTIQWADASPPTTIPCTGVVVGDLRLQPESWFIGGPGMLPHPPVTGRLVSATGLPLTHVEVSDTPVWLTVTATAATDGTWQLAATLQADAPAVPAAFVLHLHSDHPTQPDYPVIVRYFPPLPHAPSPTTAQPAAVTPPAPAAAPSATASPAPAAP